MPELPEVESIRRTLAPYLLGQAVLDAALHRRDVLIAPGDPPGGHARQRIAGSARKRRPARISAADLLQDTTITDLVRRGKQLAIIAHAHDSSTHALVVQLGMTGNLTFLPAGHEPPGSHLHASWRFRRGTLCFTDPRRFGALRIFRSTAALDEHFSTLGPDALNITTDDLARAVHGSRRPIKAALLDQALLAGVGNIYADEALFLARINPRTTAARISAPATHRLADAIRTVLAESVSAGGSTLRDFADADGRPGAYQASHRVYGRGGLPCPNCGSPLSTRLLAQRTTVWCPDCQPAKPHREIPTIFPHRASR